MAGGSLGSLVVATVVVAGVLTFTRAGDWLLTRMQEMSAECSYAFPIQAAPVSGPFCSGLASTVQGVTEMAESVGKKVREIEQRFNKVNDYTSREGRAQLGQELDRVAMQLGSSGDRLMQMVQQGPQSLSGGDITQQFQQAVDSFAIGRRYMQSDASHAVPWLQQGAQQPNGFGLLSQLSLGDLYSRGGTGVAVNPVQAQYYYRQAAQSLAQLQGSNSIQSQQMLRALPASPQQMSHDIAAAIANIGKMK